MSLRADRTSVPGENFKGKPAHVVEGLSRGLLQRSGCCVGLERTKGI